MLGIEISTVLLCTASGLIGGAIASFVNGSINKFNVTMLEKYWKEDKEVLKLRLERCEDGIRNLKSCVKQPEVINYLGKDVNKNSCNKRPKEGKK